MLEEKAIDTYLAYALEAAKAGGSMLSKFWGNLTDIKDKKIAGDLVTEADRASEAEVIAVLQSRFPDHSILAEETGLHSAAKEDFLWTIDPLDGTTNYAHGFPFAAVSVALLYHGKPIVGVVHNPMMDELFYGAKGKGAFCNRKKLAVSRIDMLEKSLLATGFSYRRRETSDNNYNEFCHLTNLTQGVRRAGCASIDLAYLAMGRFDGFWENDLNPWDIAAGALLVEEAGGKVTSYDQSPLNYMKPQILASNGLIHGQLSEQIMTIRQRLNNNQ